MSKDKKQRSGKRWSKKDNDYIKKYYLSKTNGHLSAKLNRTIDAVRKQLNFLKLRRMRKYEIEKLDKKVGKDKDIFKNLKQGTKRRKKRERELEKVEGKIKVIQDHKQKNPVSEPVKTKKEKGETTWVQINPRTRIEVPKGKEVQGLKTYEKYLQKKTTPK